MEQELWKKYRLQAIVGMLFKTVEVVRCHDATYRGRHD